jgi:hypothetical protein
VQCVRRGSRRHICRVGGDRQFALFPQKHRFQIPPGADWHAVRKVSTHIGRALQCVMHTTETTNSDKLWGIFDAQWTNQARLADAILRNLMKHHSSEGFRIERSDSLAKPTLIQGDRLGFALRYSARGKRT